jgi:hypothetical protein
MQEPLKGDESAVDPGSQVKTNSGSHNSVSGHSCEI